ncbi:uncharacterized protein LOC143240571 [Tachypleus tridentatus]|uniref:uncharacterized protein LOC143240571 n=1 Tax=Tachypleus tridentatus TaxID=6853 RepID=UPI003FD1177F
MAYKVVSQNALPSSEMKFGDDDSDEDLEALRLAALLSRKKRPNPSTFESHAQEIPVATIAKKSFYRPHHQYRKFPYHKRHGYLNFFNKPARSNLIVINTVPSEDLSNDNVDTKEATQMNKHNQLTSNLLRPQDRWCPLDEGSSSPQLSDSKGKVPERFSRLESDSESEESESDEDKLSTMDYDTDLLSKSDFECETVLINSRKADEERDDNTGNLEVMKEESSYDTSEVPKSEENDSDTRSSYSLDELDSPFKTTEQDKSISSGDCTPIKKGRMVITEKDELIKDVKESEQMVSPEEEEIRATHTQCLLEKRDSSLGTVEETSKHLLWKSDSSVSGRTSPRVKGKIDEKEIINVPREIEGRETETNIVFSKHVPKKCVHKHKKEHKARKTNRDSKKEMFELLMTKRNCEAMVRKVDKDENEARGSDKISTIDIHNKKKGSYESKVGSNTGASVLDDKDSDSDSEFARFKTFGKASDTSLVKKSRSDMSTHFYAKSHRDKKTGENWINWKCSLSPEKVRNKDQNNSKSSNFKSVLSVVRTVGHKKSSDRTRSSSSPSSSSTNEDHKVNRSVRSDNGSDSSSSTKVRPAMGSKKSVEKKENFRQERMVFLKSLQNIENTKREKKEKENHSSISITVHDGEAKGHGSEEKKRLPVHMRLGLPIKPSLLTGCPRDLIMNS